MRALYTSLLAMQANCRSLGLFSLDQAPMFSMSLSRITFHFSLLSFAVVFVSSAQAECLKYEPELVTVSGKLVRKTFAGPPNYESIKKGDTPETGFYLSVKQPVCTIASPGSEVNGSIRNVSLVQLVLEPKGYEQLRPLLGKSVTIKGSLFSAHTGHHHAPLLLNFAGIESGR